MTGSALPSRFKIRLYFLQDSNEGTATLPSGMESFPSAVVSVSFNLLGSYELRGARKKTKSVNEPYGTVAEALTVMEVEPSQILSAEGTNCPPEMVAEYVPVSWVLSVELSSASVMVIASLVVRRF